MFQHMYQMLWPFNTREPVIRHQDVYKLDKANLLVKKIGKGSGKRVKTMIATKMVTTVKTIDKP